MTTIAKRLRSILAFLKTPPIPQAMLRTRRAMTSALLDTGGIGADPHPLADMERANNMLQEELMHLDHAIGDLRRDNKRLIALNNTLTDSNMLMSREVTAISQELRAVHTLMVDGASFGNPDSYNPPSMSFGGMSS